jgi:hypothetical protein
MLSNKISFHSGNSKSVLDTAKSVVIGLIKAIIQSKANAKALFSLFSQLNY